MSNAKKPAGKAAPSRAPRKREPPSLGDLIRNQREMANVSLRNLAERTGISLAALSDIESGLRHPSRTIMSSLASALRLSAETLYLQAGVLDPKEIGEAPAVREILRDPHLNKRQRENLVEIYSAFRVANQHEGGGTEGAAPEES
jgi:transcriptional regulator with XRE-family HTH domain